MDCSYTSTRYPELRRPQTRRVDPTRPDTFPPFGPDNCGQRPGCGSTCAPVMPCVSQRPCSNPACDGGCSGNIPGGQIRPDVNPGNYQNACTNTSPGYVENMPIGMGYIPWQQWKQTYPLDTALQRGTIFPELDLPFMMGRCQP